MTSRRRKKPVKKAPARVAPEQMDELATVLTKTMQGILQAEADEADAISASPQRRENVRALQQYLAEYVAQAKRVDALLSSIGDEIGKGANLEAIILYAAAQRLGIARLPAPCFTVSATASIAEAVRVLRSGGSPLPVSLMQGTAERLQFIIEQSPLYRPGPDL